MLHAKYALVSESSYSKLILYRFDLRVSIQSLLPSVGIKAITTALRVRMLLEVTHLRISCKMAPKVEILLLKENYKLSYILKL